MLEAYHTQENERAKLGIPPLPLSAAETAEVCAALESGGGVDGAALVALLRDRVSPGVDPAAKVKAEWLARVARGEVVRSGRPPEGRGLHARNDARRHTTSRRSSPCSRTGSSAAAAADALKRTILVYGAFDAVLGLSKRQPNARAVLESWAAGEWFLSRPAFPDVPDPQGLQGGRRDQHGRFLSGQACLDPSRHSRSTRWRWGRRVSPAGSRPYGSSGRRAIGSLSRETSSGRAPPGNPPAIP